MTTECESWTNPVQQVDQFYGYGKEGENYRWPGPTDNSLESLEDMGGYEQNDISTIYLHIYTPPANYWAQKQYNLSVDVQFVTHIYGDYPKRVEAQLQYKKGSTWYIVDTQTLNPQWGYGIDTVTLSHDGNIDQTSNCKGCPILYRIQLEVIDDTLTNGGVDISINDYSLEKRSCYTVSGGGGGYGDRTP